jgi:hypothetical protein
MKITIPSYVFIYTVLLRFFESKSARFMCKNSSRLLLASMVYFNLFLGVELLHICLCSVPVAMQGGVLRWLS